MKVLIDVGIMFGSGLVIVPAFLFLDWLVDHGCWHDMPNESSGALPEANRPGVGGMAP